MMLRPGDTLGRYTIEAQIGAGGMGCVYRAHDARLDRSVAIKMVSDAAAGESRRRILREARAASSLTHPSICTVYDVIDEGEQPFIVMELVEGQPLSSFIAAGGLPSERIVALARPVADALAYAHARGIVHRDLKAANVVVTTDGRPKVLDFGLAVAFGERRNTGTWNSLELPGKIMGTPGYMSPQQLQGEPGDPRDDIWAFGVLVYEMAAGRRPFSGSDFMAVYAAVLNQEPPPLSPTVSPGLREMVARCLSKSAEDRFQKAEELIAALDFASAGGTVALTAVGSQPPLVVTAPPPLTGGSAPGLVGRGDELDVLERAWERTRAGRRQLVLIAGEPGIGKTRLTAEFARGAFPEGIVLFGRCDQEALVPYQPFVEALEWYARECPQRALEAQFRQVSAASELAQLVPLFAKRIALGGDRMDVNVEGQRYRLFGAVASLLSAAARARPLLLVLDDVHWADRPTLLMLRHLMRATADVPLCMVATYRDTELDRTHPLAETLADLRREDGVTRLPLRGLSAADVRAFVGGWTAQDVDRLTAVVVERTEGNPFFMTEVLRHLRETGALDQSRGARGATRRDDYGLPEGVREVIGRRLARLSDACNRVLAVAAVIGREFSFDVLQRVADVSEDQLLDLVDEASTARVIVESGASHGRYTFTHALVRETLYEELATPRRVRLHKRVADTLEALTPDRLPLADLAFHLSEAVPGGESERAVAYAIRAAEAAAVSFALEEAARFYEMALHALELLPDNAETRKRRCDLHVRRSHAFGSVGLWAAAKSEAQRAIDLLGSDERLRRCELLIDMAKYSFWLLDIASVQRFAPEALAIATEYGRDDLWADMTAWVGAALQSDGDVENSLVLQLEAVKRAGGIRTFALASAPLVMYFAGHVEDAIRHGSQAVRNAREAADPPFRLYALEHLGLALTGTGRYDEALSMFEEARQVGRQCGVLPLLARSLAMHAGVYMALGDYRQAEALSMEARELAREAAFNPPSISAGIDLLFASARSHNPGRAEALMDDVSAVIETAAGWHGWLWRMRLAQARGEIALARGDWGAALDFSRTALDQSVARKRPKYEALSRITIAQALHAKGETRTASDDISKGLSIARRLLDPALILRALGAHLAIDGSDTLAREAKETVSGVLEHVADERLRAIFLASELAAPIAIS